MDDIVKRMAEDYEDGEKNPSAVIISIPTAANSHQENEQELSKVYHGSSSEDANSEAEDQQTSDKPDVLLKKARRRARSCDKEESIRERIRCVALARIVYGDCHWQLAKAYSKLAHAYFTAGLALQALGHAGNARDILVASDAISYQGHQHYNRKDVIPVIERMYLIMGQSLLMLKQYQKAENSLKKAQLVSKERSSLGKEYRHTERSVKIDLTLGKTAIKLGKAGFALECFEKALELVQEEFGSKSKHLITIYQNIGQAELLQGNDVTSRERALESYLKAHAIAREKYKDESIEVADSSMAVASVYCVFDDDYQQSKAQEHLQSAYNTYSMHEGPYSCKTIRAEEELCHLLIRNNSIEESIKLLKHLLSSKLAVYGDPSVKAANVHHLLGSIYLKKGKIDTALQHLTSCRSMLACVFGTNHRKTQKIQATMDAIKRAPNAKNFMSSEEKLKERPRFSQVVGRSKPLGSSGVIGD